MRSIVILAVVALLVTATPLQAGKEFSVVATTLELAAIARAVVGEAGTVYGIARPDQDPHYVQAKPSHMVKLRKADAVLYTGLQLEIGWLPKLLEGARNPAIMPGRPGNLYASCAIERILEVPAGDVDRSQGDVHPEGNPHYILDPHNGVRVAKWMALRFGELDRSRAELYRANAEKFTARVESHIERWERKAESLKGLKVIAYHKQWEYLVDWLDLDLVGYIEDRPGIAPSPRHIQDLEKRIQGERIGIILMAHYVPSRAPEILADRTGARALTLPATATGKDGVETYSDMFDCILGQLLPGEG